MRIRTTKTKNGRLFYVVKTYYDSQGGEHTMTVEKLGNEHDIRLQYGCDPDLWAKEHVAKLNQQEKLERQDVVLSFSKSKQLTKNYRYEFQAGYLFLQSIYYQLGLDTICYDIQKRHAFSFDLNSILSRLLYGRILDPASKSSTFRFAQTLLETPHFDEHQIYRALDVLADESDFIQQALYQNSFVFGKRHTGIVYYDCTNFFFEIEDADAPGLRQYGKSKENRPLPLVELGMFIDQDGIPLAVCLHPGNTNEQTTLNPIEKRMIADFNMAKFVVCTDAGLASKANRKFNDVRDRAFIVTQSLKTLKHELRDWALDPSGWQLVGGPRHSRYDLTNLDAKTDFERLYYKERWIDHGTFEEKILVTFSLKYQQYQRNLRNGQIARAEREIRSGAPKLKKCNPTDYRRLIRRTSVTEDGELAETDRYALHRERIAVEEAYDGFYAVCSNLDDAPEAILQVTQQRWQIEECFRMMKSEFRSRPAYVQTDSHIEAHFLTCFLAPVLYRYLEKKLAHRFTCRQIISTLQEIRMREVLGEGYIPTYTRTEVTDALHDAFGFRTDYHILVHKDMKKILKASQSKI